MLQGGGVIKKININNENILFTGAFRGNNSIIDLDPSSNTFELVHSDNNSSQVFFVKYSLEGELQWGFTFPGSGFARSSEPLFIGSTSDNKVVTLARLNGENDISAYGDEYIVSSNSDGSSSVRTLIAVYNQGYLSTQETNISNSEVVVFPNPSQHTNTLIFNKTQTEQTTIDLYDIQGRLIQPVYEGLINDGFEISIDISKLSSGMYLYRIANASSQQAIKFIKE